MNFRDQHYYMHSNALDTAIQVIKVQFIAEEYVKMKADYINLGYTGKPWIMRRMNHFIVKKEQYDSWISLREPDLYVVRTKPGLPTMQG